LKKYLVWPTDSFIDKTATKWNYRSLMEIEKVKQIGIRAAYQSGEVLKRYFGNLKAVIKKGEIDLVTQADIESEKVIIETIRTAFPDHSILAEESGSIDGRPEACWIIDPLDGTTNFAHGLGIFAVSIAFFHDNKPIYAIVFNPCSGELFTAESGQGAYLNNRLLSVSKAASVRDSLLATGFPYNLERLTAKLMDKFESCLLAAQGIRRLGSAALDLCSVACGRMDGFWEENLSPWDTAAGMLIAQAAGGSVTDFDGQPFSIEKKQILATNGRIHSEMLALLSPKETQ
jgi:myo-inositol-1(or 4)-monophosphatase